MAERQMKSRKEGEGPFSLAKRRLKMEKAMKTKNDFLFKKNPEQTQRQNAEKGKEGIWSKVVVKHKTGSRR